MRKIYSLVFVALLLMSASFSFAQQTSFGKAPDLGLPPSISSDNPLNANNRGFVYISGTSSHQWNKQFMGNVTVTPIGSPFTTASWVGATARKPDGTIYVCNQASPFQIWSLDTTSGNATLVVTCTGVPHANFTGIVWDHTTNTMYGCSSDITTSAIFTINMTTGACTQIGTNTAVCAAAIGIFCAPNGSLFSDDIVGNNLYKWDKTTGVPTLVGPLNFDANYGQDGAFDLSDGILYLASAGPGNILRTCDTTTGNATNVIGTYAGQPSCLSIVANSGPTITHTPLPNTQNVTGPYVVNANILAPGSATISSAKVFWSRNNPTVTDSVTMTNSGSNYSGNIPGNGTNATYRYFIKAIASDNSIGQTSLYTFTASSTDTTKPVITHTAIGPTPKANWPVAVTATVTDNIGIDSAWVRWYKSSAPSTVKQFKILNTTGNTYSALFNSLNNEVVVGDIINYRIIAQDNSAQHNRDSTALYNFTIINEITVTIGTGTTSGNFPYTTYWMDGRTQYLYLASELNFPNGTIGKVGFDVITADPGPMNGFKINIATTTLTALTGFESTGFTTCYSPASYTVPGTGWQVITLTTPFNYTAGSNIIIEVCYNNSAYTQYSPVNTTAAPGMFWGRYNDLSTADGCGYTAWTSTTAPVGRANTRIVFNPTVGVGNNQNELPTKFNLAQNYPNPFNPTTKINFSIAKAGFVTLKIYDVLGREVKTLVNEVKQVGNFSVDFNASEFSSGVYFYKMETNGFSDIKKMMLIK